MLDYFVLPQKKITGSFREKAKKIDYLGILLSAAGTVLVLVPISGGGTTFAWDSAVVISLLIIGVLCLVAFIWQQYKFSPLPIFPCEYLRYLPCTG